MIKKELIKLVIITIPINMKHTQLCSGFIKRAVKLGSATTSIVNVNNIIPVRRRHMLQP